MNEVYTNFHGELTPYTHSEYKDINDLLDNKAQGVYIDVGALHPSMLSVTEFFYNKGWSGINIEPLHAYYLDLLRARPRDINLNVACGAEEGTLDLWSSNALSTLVNEFRTPESFKVEVPVVTLKSICDEYIQNTPIDFLKIDVEGFELQVIQGMDWNNYHPTVLCIEYTKPGSHILNCEQWEPLIFEQGYKIMVDDTFNRFYM